MRGLAIWLTMGLLTVGASPAGAVEKDSPYTEELLAILEETGSVDAFMLTLHLLQDLKLERHKVVPLVIRHAERLGILADHFGDNRKQLAEDVDAFLEKQAAKRPVKKSKVVPAAAEQSDSCQPEIGPVPPWVNMEDKYSHKNDFRTPVVGPPIREGVPPPPCEDPPDEAVVLRAMLRVARTVPYLYEESRDDIQVVTELTVDKVDPPRFFPLIGPAQLHHCHWKCTIYYTETCISAYPFPVRIVRPRVQVMYIDKDHLHLYQVGSSESNRQLTRDLSGN